MISKDNGVLSFDSETVKARFVDPNGEHVEHTIEIRTNPITNRSCRITHSRINEQEAGAETLPEPPPGAKEYSQCPFCKPQLFQMTPKLNSDRFSNYRLEEGDSILFPNLFPYGSYSGVSLFDDHHFVEIGTANLTSYSNSFANCAKFLKEVRGIDSAAYYMAITQNHLPSAGGSLVHPHLQVYADRVASNTQRMLEKRATEYHAKTGNLIYGDYLDHETAYGSRYIGTTGDWKWMAAFAPEGFFEIWGVLPGIVSIFQLNKKQWEALAQGVLNTQKFYRNLNRNGYNLGLLSVEKRDSKLELKISIVVRSNYAPWVRNDYTGFEVMLGDMATFTAPEKIAEMARPFWSN